MASHYIPFGQISIWLSADRVWNEIEYDEEDP